MLIFKYEVYIGIFGVVDLWPLIGHRGKSLWSSRFSRRARKKDAAPRRWIGNGNTPVDSPAGERESRRGIITRAVRARVKRRAAIIRVARIEKRGRASERGVNDLSARSFDVRWCSPFDVYTPRGGTEREYVRTWPLVDLSRGHWTKAGPTCRSLYSGTYVRGTSSFLSPAAVAERVREA